MSALSYYPGTGGQIDGSTLPSKYRDLYFEIERIFNMPDEIELIGALNDLEDSGLITQECVIHTADGKAHDIEFTEFADCWSEWFDNMDDAYPH